MGGLCGEICVRIPTISLQTEPVVARSQQKKNDKVINDIPTRDIIEANLNVSVSFFVISVFRLKLLHQFTKLMVVFFFWRFLMARSKKLRDLWSRFLGMMVSMFKFLPIAA